MDTFFRILASVWPILFFLILVWIYLNRILRAVKKFLLNVEDRLERLELDIHRTEETAKKGNKDQQEIKTKLTNLRQSTDKNFGDLKKLLPKKKS